jgi:hypothetical protein
VTSERRPSLGSRAATLCLCALLALGAASVHAPTAFSAGLNNPLGELSEHESTTTPTTTATTSTETNSSSNSSTVVILALLAAGALLVGIAFVIVRDARRVAPVTDAELAEGGPARDSAARLRRRRAKAKAARQQRKRNR